MIDAHDIKTSNWIRFINCSRNSHEDNVQAVDCAGRVYMMTKKHVHPGQELMFYYGNEYAEELGINYY